MEPTGKNIFESFAIDTTVEPVNPPRVQHPFKQEAHSTGEVERLAAEGHFADSLLVDLGGLAFDKVLEIGGEKFDASMERLLHGIDNAAGSFGGYNPNQSE